jgi:hypothetical protein
MNGTFFTKNASTSAAAGGGMSSNWTMALLYLGGLFALGGAKGVAAITGAEIAKEGGARLCVIIGYKDDGAVFSCNEGASASLVGLFFYRMTLQQSQELG